MKAKIIISISLLSITISAYSQWIPDNLTTSPVLLENDSNKLTINAYVLGFLKNNEYFSPIVKGETFPGVRIRPTVAYQLGTNLKAELGMTGLSILEINKKMEHIYLMEYMRNYNILSSRTSILYSEIITMESITD